MPSLSTLYKNYNGRSIEDDGSVKSEDFKKFCSMARSAIRTDCKKLGLTLMNFSCGHYFFSGFVRSSNGKFGYFNFDVPRGDQPIDFDNSSWMNDGRILCRSAKGPKDYTSGANNFVHIKDLAKKLNELTA